MIQTLKVFFLWQLQVVPKESTLAEEMHLKLTEIIPDTNSHTFNLAVYVDLNY